MPCQDVFIQYKITYEILAKLSFKAVCLSVYVTDTTTLIKSSCQTTVSFFFFKCII